MSEMVKVKLMAHGLPLGNYGAVVDVTPAVAAELCKERDRHDGYQVKKVRVAIPLEEAEAKEKAEAELRASPMALDGLSQAEAAALGLKNVTPSDPNDIGEANKVAAQRKADKAKAEKTKKAEK